MDRKKRITFHVAALSLAICLVTVAAWGKDDTMTRARLF